MAVSNEFVAYVLEQLAAIEGLRARRMFSGVGLYCDDLFFGLIAGDVLYFRVDEASRAEYVARGMAPFRPYRDRPELSFSYFELPADALEDGESCVLWARRAISVAASAPRRRPRRSRGPPKSLR